jgi:hypothetical protein
MGSALLPVWLRLHAGVSSKPLGRTRRERRPAAIQHIGRAAEARRSPRCGERRSECTRAPRGSTPSAVCCVSSGSPSLSDRARSYRPQATPRPDLQARRRLPAHATHPRCALHAAARAQAAARSTLRVGPQARAVPSAQQGCRAPSPTGSRASFGLSGAAIRSTVALNTPRSPPDNGRSEERIPAEGCNRKSRDGRTGRRWDSRSQFWPSRPLSSIGFPARGSVMAGALGSSNTRGRSCVCSPIRSSPRNTYAATARTTIGGVWRSSIGGRSPDARC